MRASLVRLASSAASSSPLMPRDMALLPPIYLYRRLLRAHRKHLPAEMRLLGDEYIKAEFRAHRNVDNPAHLVSHHPYKSDNSGICDVMLTEQIGFLTEWQLYAQQVEGDSWIGAKIDQGKLAKMSGKWPKNAFDMGRRLTRTDEQIAQLYELMQSIQNRGKEGAEE